MSESFTSPHGGLTRAQQAPAHPQRKHQRNQNFNTNTTPKFLGSYRFTRTQKNERKEGGFGSQHMSENNKNNQGKPKTRERGYSYSKRRERRLKLYLFLPRDKTNVISNSIRSHLRFLLQEATKRGEAVCVGCAKTETEGRWLPCADGRRKGIKK